MTLARRRLGIALAAILTVCVLGPLGARALADGSTLITSCDARTLSADVAAGGSYVFQCSGTITLQQQLVVPNADNVTLDANGQSVTIQGCADPCNTRL